MAELQKKISHNKEGKLKTINHKSPEKLNKTPNNAKTTANKSSNKHDKKENINKNVSPGVTRNVYCVTDENKRVNNYDSKYKERLQTEKTPPVKRKLIEINTSILNDKSQDNSFVSRKTPLNLNFIKTKYNTFGDASEKDNSYIENYHKFSKQLKTKLEIDEEDDPNDDIIFDTDRNQIRKNYLAESKEISRTLNELKERFKLQQSSNYTRNLVKTPINSKQNKVKNLTPNRVNKDNSQRNRDNSNNMKTLEKESSEFLIESLEKIKIFVEKLEKKNSDLKYYYKTHINYLTNQITEISNKEKKLKKDLLCLQNKFNSNQLQHNKSEISGKATSENSLPNFNKEKLFDSKGFEKNKKTDQVYQSYLHIFKQLGVDANLFYKEGDLNNNLIDPVNDICECKVFEDHKCGKNDIAKWNYKLFLENSKLKNFFELILKKVKNGDNFEHKSKIFSRIPKNSHNISMISSVKSDLGKDIINDIRDDSILREIPC